ncbi:MAG: selenocysteine-specific translation elongation factor [Alphaproteobacteria bacterium]|nr:selenocysteine-specific translation elongation factor [Alphaproteobacteria bacterium]
MTGTTSRTLLLGTAGHIDHGKTSLVRLLTGADLDTLPEEKARGITIALGFTSLALPDGRQAALIDVPGHERLVRTMIAGATGLDAVLLVVSAVDGVMPQTREHLAILQLLGVEQGLVALTMADLVDDELLELAAADVEDTVRGTFLEGAPIIPTSTEDGRGRDALLGAIAGLAAPERDDSGPFRLPVDRAFSRPGFGTVVTGSSWSGTLRDGSTVTLLPEGREVRVRGMEVHGVKTDEAGPGRRVALNLAGVETDAVPRGTVVARGDLPCPHMVDVVYTHLASAEPLDDGASVRVLLGTAECIGRLHVAVDRDALVPGRTVPAQLRLDSPLPCLPGDRFIVRRTSPLETLGGGTVVDPWTRKMRRRDREAWGRDIDRLAKGDRLVWLERAGDLGLSPAEWKARGDGGGVQVADRVFAPKVLARLQGALVEALADFHVENPLALGAHRRELRRGRLGHLPEKLFDALVDRLAERSQVHVEGPMVRADGFRVALTSDQLGLRDALIASIAEAGLNGLSPKEIHALHPEPEVAALLRLVEDGGAAQQVAGIGWVSKGALDGLLTDVRGWFAGHDVLSPGEFKDLSSLTRKAAIPLLEWLDKNRYTAFGAEGRRTRGSRL